MKFIQCKNCSHFNPIKSEYQIFCDACGKKNPDNFKAWQQKNPNKNFEDFKTIVGVDKTKPKKIKKKLTPKQFLQRLTLGLMFAALFFVANKYSSKLYSYFHELAFPVSELLDKEWERQYFSNKTVSFESPYLLKENKSELPLADEVKNLVVEMNNYLYNENPLFNIVMSSVKYHESVGVVSIKGASDGSIQQAMQQANGDNLYYSDTDTYINQYPAIIKKGNFTSDGNTVYFKSITCIKNNFDMVFLVAIWIGENESYELLTDRIINSFDMR
ncbi:hypothetical protein [Wenyingzhuangia sp. IMCC45467]